MNIYLVTTTLPFGYDCADEFVVQAETGDDAREMTLGYWGDHNDHILGTLQVQKLGVVTADLPQVQQIVLRSFNAG